MGEFVIKGKKIIKESRFKKGREEGIFLQQIWGFLGIVRAEREGFKGRGRKHGKDQWRFSHRKEVFPGMFTVDPSLIPIILLMYEFSLDFESRFDARG